MRKILTILLILSLSLIFALAPQGSARAQLCFTYSAGAQYWTVVQGSTSGDEVWTSGPSGSFGTKTGYFAIVAFSTSGSFDMAGDPPLLEHKLTSSTFVAHNIKVYNGTTLDNTMGAFEGNSDPYDWFTTYGNNDPSSDTLVQFLIFSETLGAMGMRNMRVCISGSAPSTPEAPQTALAAREACILLGDNNANFANPNDWVDNPEMGAPNEGGGLAMPAAGGVTRLYLKLKPTAKYKFKVRFNNPDSVSARVFYVTIGAAPPIPISISAVSTNQTYESTYYDWPPDLPEDPTPWTLEINHLPQDNPFTLYIRFICLYEEPAPADMADLEKDAACSDCIYQPTGDLIQDIGQFIGWLWCGIARFFSCVIGTMIRNIWGVILQIAGFLGSVLGWLAQAFLNIVTWIGSAISTVAAWVGGHLANFLTVAIDFIRALVGSAIGGLGAFVGVLFQLAYTIISAILSIFEFAGQAIGWIGTALGTLGLLFTSLVSSVNASAATIPAWAPTCADQGSFLFGPCLGFYILDNTVFSGPVFYLIPIIMAIIGWVTIQWSLRSIQSFFAEL